MYEEPEEDPVERSLDPTDEAKQKFDQFRMHAEFAAVFEGTRKFDAQIITALDAEIARQVQRGVAKLEKAKPAESPVLPPESFGEADDILMLVDAKELSTNDYHIHRRPGE